MYKNKEYGGLDAVELSDRLKIAFVKTKQTKQKPSASITRNSLLKNVSLSESIMDVLWLLSVGKLHVRAVAC